MQKNKRGAVLIENVVFIILNILFITILILFLLRQGQGAIVLEQSYAKQIALLIDSAKPGTVMVLNMEKAKNLAEKNGVAFENILIQDDNVITIRLSDKGGYSYAYFNNVDVSIYPDTSDPENINSYAIVINEYK